MSFTRLIQLSFISLLFTMVTSCGGGSSSSSNETSPPPPPLTPQLQESSTKTALNLDITAANIVGDQVTISFQLVDIEGIAITHLSAEDFSVTLAQLNPSEVGNNTGDWQSYINKIEMPGIGNGTEPKMQAKTESGAVGTFVNNGDGTYQYTYAQSVSTQPQEIQEQAKIEGLDLSHKPSVVHRSGMQLTLDEYKRNATFDWIPQTGENQIDGIFDHAITSTENCNTCHGELAIHGGSRTEIKYCVTCHNPGSTDANSGNTVNFKNMIHKIHRGKNLPSVEAGGEYVIYGYRDSKHDYSNLVYPNDILSCQICHAGNATAEPNQTPTVSGDNWREIATQATCGSCHDDLDFNQHYGGQSNDENCMSCHQNSAVARSISDSHKNLTIAASSEFHAEIINVSNTQAGEFPIVQFKVTNPETGKEYDLLNDPEWTQEGSSSLSIDLAWTTKDYTNTGNQGDNSNSVSLNALDLAVDNGDGSFKVTSTTAIPDGSLAPNYVATGSGGVFISGHPAVVLDEENPSEVSKVGLNNVIDYFSIDEAEGNAIARRVSVTTEQCLVCHGQLIKHGDSKVNNVQACVTCHNPRNTDKRTRDVAQTPPTDGKLEESLDFKTMIHAIHASGKRENPLQLVGYKGFSTKLYDTNNVRYPNKLSQCDACHTEDSYQLPIVEHALGTTITSNDTQNHDDDIVISPVTAVCSSCHDNSEAKIHMESNGGSFSTTQNQIDNGITIEQCTICHGSGKSYAVEKVHVLN